MAEKVYPSAQLPKIWTLYYRFKNMPPLTKNFIFEGDLPLAITRAKEHCTKMGYKFLCVRPFLIDLEEQESRRQDFEEI